MNNRIVLGTVQFGLEYGINNKTGKPSDDEVFQILSLCSENNIHFLDTAHVYGDSEERIGKFCRENGKSFSIISKLPDCKKDDVKKTVESSLSRLKTEKLYAYLFHSIKSLEKNPGIYDELLIFKAKGKINKIGFSLYNTDELEMLLEKKIDFDLIQVPFNVFDRRFEPYFSSLKDIGIEVHARSVYLQGLFFQNPGDMSDYFESVKGKVNLIQELSYKSGIGIQELCLSFVLSRKYIDKVVVGVDSISQCVELIAGLSQMQKNNEYFEELEKMKVNDLNILLPYKWKI